MKTRFFVMRRLLSWAMPPLIFGAVTGCAIFKPSFDSASKSFPPLQANQRRIFFYRDNRMLNAGVYAKIYVNGESVGLSSPGVCFYVDRPAGTYIVSCPTGLGREHAVSCSLAAGETKYIRTTPTWSVLWTITPTIENEDTAMKTLVTCRYWGEWR
jgi:hypothetical protein